MSTIVIGGGIAGCTVALALRERGSAVTLVQGSKLPGAATPASAGMVAPQYESHPSDPTFRLGMESAARYSEFLAGVNALAGSAVELEGDGMLVANFNGPEHEAATLAARDHRAEGLEADVLDGAEAASLEPAATADAESFLWFPSATRLDCRALAGALIKAVDAAGVRRVSDRASGVLSEGDRATGVRLEEGGSVEGSGVVLAAGCWSGELTGLPRRLPVRPVRGQMLRLTSGRLPTGPVLADHAGRYLIPRPGGGLAGSTMDEAGWVPEVTEAGRAFIRDAARRLCPVAGDASVVEEWAGLRPISDDGLPIVGPDPELAGLCYATGYGRSGILLAPLVAEIVGDLALGREPGIAWRAMSIDRFGAAGASSNGEQ